MRRRLQRDQAPINLQLARRRLPVVAPAFSVGMVDVLLIASANVEAGGKTWRDWTPPATWLFVVGQAFEDAEHDRRRSSPTTASPR